MVARDTGVWEMEHRFPRETIKMTEPRARAGMDSKIQLLQEKKGNINTHTLENSAEKVWREKRQNLNKNVRMVEMVEKYK